MKAITIHQPWATALAVGIKKFETRPRRSNHRGPIAIHAGLTMNEEALGDLMDIDWGSYIQRPLSRKWSLVGPQDFTQGAIIAVGELTDCLEMDDALIAAQSQTELRMGHWEPGRFAYQFENITPVGPFPASGKQGLWNWDEAGYK